MQYSIQLPFQAIQVYQLTERMIYFIMISFYFIIISLCNISKKKNRTPKISNILKMHVKLDSTGFVFNFQVAILVYNRLKMEGVTIHWHGLLHKGTPWMDGASMISQCPIMPGQVFEYR